MVVVWSVIVYPSCSVGTGLGGQGDGESGGGKVGVEGDIGVIQCIRTLFIVR